MGIGTIGYNNLARQLLSMTKKFHLYPAAISDKELKKTFKGFQVYNCESHSHHQQHSSRSAECLIKKAQLVDIE